MKSTDDTHRKHLTCSDSKRERKTDEKVPISLSPPCLQITPEVEYHPTFTVKEGNSYFGPGNYIIASTGKQA